MITRFVGVALLVVLTSTTSCQTPDGAAPAAAPSNQELLAAARSEQPALIQSLQDTVSIASGSDDVSGLAKMADYTAGRLRTLGAAVELIGSTAGKPTKLVKGSFTGGGTLRIMLIAHLDTVYRQNALDTDPYHRDGNRLYGPGVADDKGGVAVILHALSILHSRDWADYAQLTVLFNPDEEVGSPGSGEIIAELGSQHDVVLSFEPSPARDAAGAEGVLLKAAGVAAITLRVTGRAAHAGAAPEAGRNALIELAYQLQRTRDLADGINGVQMNWTTANAGTVPNQIPDHAEAAADVRITEAGAADTLLAAVKRTVDQAHLVPDTRDDVTLEITRPMFDAGENGRALAELAQSIYADLPNGDLAGGSTEITGRAGDTRTLALIPGTTGGTDAGFAARSGKPAVLEGLGLAGWNYHRPGEYVEVDSIVPRLYLAVRMLTELGARADAGRLP